MRKYILKRLLYIVLVALILSFLMYLIYNMIPYDRAATMARNEIKANMKAGLKFEELYSYYQKLIGTDGNLFQRYLRWLGLYPNTLTGKPDGIFEGNFGFSMENNKPAVEVIKEPMKNTIFINIFATILGLGITIPLGIRCAVKRGSKFDTAVQVGTIIGYSLPVFITAILFIFLFSALLGWFPVSGMKTPGSNYTGFKWFADRMYYMALPLIVMTFCSLGGMTRYVRAAMIEALSLDCIRTARAKGLREKVVIYTHAWRNALLPVVTLIIGWFLGIFGGSMMIENIFGLNGVGRLYIISLTASDYEVVLCLQMFYVLISLLGNLIVDLVYGLVDPRVRVSK